jgi:hypothetical protein
VAISEAYDGRSAIEATVEPSGSESGLGGWKSLDERWVGLGYAARTGTPTWLMEAARVTP